MDSLKSILTQRTARHKHLCPRQVLGARMSVLAGKILGLELPRSDKQLLIFAETDGCTVDGIIAATGCHVGGRTLRILDYGKVAATFIDTCTETSIRIHPSPHARALALEFAPQACNRGEAMLFGYQVMPATELFSVQLVQLHTTVSHILGRAGRKVICRICGEEIINGREISMEGMVRCRSCAGDGYYNVTVPFEQEATQLADPCTPSPT